jgi:hypothetical protein
VCAFLGGGVIALSFDRDHEVALAELAADEHGKDTQLPVQVGGVLCWLTASCIWTGQGGSGWRVVCTLTEGC